MIECRDISKSYFNVEIETLVLKKISFQIKDGEFVAIVGPSGSGKSTLMHILGALDTPTSGKYFLNKKEISKLSDNELADLRKNKIGFVFQTFNLLPRATVLRNVYLPLLYTNASISEREEKAKETLKAVGIEKEHFYKLSNQLSGGQTQRVAIARALINNPKIILADEPTGNLDTKSGELVMQTFNKLNKEGKTIILITHEQNVARHARRIITLRDGEIISDKKS